MLHNSLSWERCFREIKWPGSEYQRLSCSWNCFQCLTLAAPGGCNPAFIDLKKCWGGLESLLTLLLPITPSRPLQQPPDLCAPISPRAFGAVTNSKFIETRAAHYFCLWSILHMVPSVFRACISCCCINKFQVSPHTRAVGCSVGIFFPRETVEAVSADTVESL